MGWTKLFSEIVTSSIWSEDDRTRLVWVTMLALKNQNGVVLASMPGLAHISHVPLDDCQKAIGKLEAPDPYSRTQDHEGRRIKPIPGGWLILNHAKYRDGLSDDPETAAARERMRRMRKNRSEPDASAPHAPPNTDNTEGTDTDTDTVLRNVTPLLRSVTPCSNDGKEGSNLPPSGSRVIPDKAMMDGYAAQIGMLPVEVQKCFDHFEASGWTDKYGHPVMNWQASMRSWKTRGEESKALRRASAGALVDYSPMFEAFFGRYPEEGRTGKLEAWNAWLECLPQIEKAAKGDMEAWLIRLDRKLRKLAASPKWKEQGGKFIPKPATFLRNGGWEE